MLQQLTHASARQALHLLGWYPADAPASYADGAEVPATIPVPVVPSPAPAATRAAPTDLPDALSPEALDAAASEALSDAHRPTPLDHEPGLMEDLTELPLTPANVEEVLDEMVRPALNADGGDISLVKIDGDDVYVRLVGACNTCPSSVMTMRMGVERLLQEEFPQMGELIQVDAMM